MLAALGQDSFAQPLEKSLSDAGVVLHKVESSEPTGTAFICVSDDAENAITVAPGANNSLLPGHLPALTGFSHLLMQLETPLATVTAYAQAARSAGVTTVLNAAPAQRLPAELLAAIDVLVVNEGELAAITGHNGSIAEGLAQLQVPTVVVTLGARGCCARERGNFHLQNAYRIEPLDTTAAGDTFCGALVAALSQGQALPAALTRACAASAMACTRLGAQSSIPATAEVDAFVQAQSTLPDTQALRQFCGL